MRQLRIVTMVLLLTACSILPGSEQAVPTTAVPAPPTDMPAPTPTESAVQPEPTATSEPAPVQDVESFVQDFARVLESLDYQGMRIAMGERFIFANYGVDLTEVDSPEAYQRLQTSVFAPGAQPQVSFEVDIAEMLSGLDPLELWGPVNKPVRALYVQGLGENADEEAVVVIGLDRDANVLYWQGILLPRAGRFDTLLPEDVVVAETDIEAVITSVDLNVRIGPGIDYAVLGLLSAGQTVEVNGASQDGAWYRIDCTLDASGLCWISASPDFSTPTSAP